jgi:hypothetical protein
VAQPHAASVAAAGATMSRDPDIAEHEAMYHRFTGLVKWGIIGCAVLVVLLFIAIHPMVPPPAS